jgi:hypothetical protein
MRILSIDPGLRHLALCVVDATDHSASIQAWRTLELDAITPGDVVSLFESAARDVEGVEVVVIEQQPPCNGSMKKLECYLHMYCVLKLQVPCHVVSSKLKLRCLKTQPTTYRQRKLASVEKARACVEGTAFATVFDEAAKKDDLADCYLQARAWVQLQLEKK